MRRLKFSKWDFMHILFSSLIIAFLFNFRIWGDTTFDINQGLENLLKLVIIVYSSILLRLFVQKVYLATKGVSVRYTFSKLANTFGLLLALITNGILFIFSAGYLHFHVDKLKRMGKLRHRPQFDEFAFAVGFGILTHLAIATLFSFQTGFVADKFVLINLVMAFFLLIPIPSFDGFHLFASNSFYYFAITGFTIGYGVLFLFVSPWIALISGAVAAFVLFLIGYKMLYLR